MTQHAELWGRAEALLPKLRERATRSEELRRMPDETIRDFHDAELFRIHQPKRVGGAELEFAAVVTFGALFARACASTSWNWVNFAAHHMMLGMFPREVQDEVWNKSRDAMIASSFVFPAGQAKKVEGGYVLSGRWPFSSGVDPSEWNMLAGLARLEENAPPAARELPRSAGHDRSRQCAGYQDQGPLSPRGRLRRRLGGARRRRDVRPRRRERTLRIGRHAACLPRCARGQAALLLQHRYR